MRQTFARLGSTQAGSREIQIYQARDPRALDSSAKIRRVEYLPVTLYALVDARDSIEQLLVVAWQQYMWRFSERLSPTDKEYFTPIPMSFSRTTDSAVVTWAYPNLDTRDDDLRNITPYRNSYWSLDAYRMGSGSEEIFKGDIRSYPQFEPYDPQSRFVPGGPFERAHADTTPVYTALRNYIQLTSSAQSVDTTRR